MPYKDKERERARLKEKHKRLGNGNSLRLLKSYGITQEDYDVMSEQQGHVCAICGNAETATIRGVLKRLSVDHCHQSGKVRGLLCADCNRALGMFKDNPSTIRKAADYLEVE